MVLGGEDTPKNCKTCSMCWQVLEEHLGSRPRGSPTRVLGLRQNNRSRKVHLGSEGSASLPSDNGDLAAGARMDKASEMPLRRRSGSPHLAGYLGLLKYLENGDRNLGWEIEKGDCAE